MASGLVLRGSRQVISHEAAGAGLLAAAARGGSRLRGVHSGNSAVCSFPESGQNHASWHPGEGGAAWGPAGGQAAEPPGAAAPAVG